ncbi:RNA polymerase sigma factor [Sphingobacterium griseoflavum]|uniref:DNA-directed RNA polymerase sigma-70 factor n=1 Tax=Sphingobacterium griseoflavum TaxID=1474952 RepID=A0ABQ3HQ67_9SPHI|nr:sigma-70 family RNA polymerase sigma factor [Sphingobacterium griseoflavum]GHE23376.1 DNA-directed RNA polymerase sigma-70 factor [Sphingobacterium griseoflavum]
MAQIIPLYQNWLIAIKESDSRSAFSAVYTKFWKDLFVHALKRLKDEQHAEDIVQELFVHFWEQRQKLDTEMNLPAYLYGMLKYKIVDYFNSCKAKPQLLAYWAEDMHQYVIDHPEELHAYLHLEGLLDQELQKMSHNMREAILLKWDQLSIKEIAEKLNLSEQTVKNNLTDGSKRLKRSLLLHSDGQYGVVLGFAFQSIAMLIP